MHHVLQLERKYEKRCSRFIRSRLSYPCLWRSPWPARRVLRGAKLCHPQRQRKLRPRSLPTTASTGRAPLRRRFGVLQAALHRGSSLLSGLSRYRSLLNRYLGEACTAAVRKRDDVTRKIGRANPGQFCRSVHSLTELNPDVRRVRVWNGRIRRRRSLFLVTSNLLASILIPCLTPLLKPRISRVIARKKQEQRHQQHRLPPKRNW